MSGHCQIVINPELAHESFSQFTPIRKTRPVPDMQSESDPYSGTSKLAAPRAFKFLSIELDRETDGRWIAEIPEIPGAMVYGHSREHAVSEVRKLAFSVLIDDKKDFQGAFGVRYTFLIEDAA